MPKCLTHSSAFARRGFGPGFEHLERLPLGRFSPHGGGGGRSGEITEGRKGVLKKVKGGDVKGWTKALVKAGIHVQTFEISTQAWDLRCWDVDIYWSPGSFIQYSRLEIRARKDSSKAFGKFTYISSQLSTATFV